MCDWWLLISWNRWNHGGHSTLEVTGMIEKGLKTRSLLVRGFSSKEGSFREKTNKKKGGVNYWDVEEIF